MSDPTDEDITRVWKACGGTKSAAEWRLKENGGDVEKTILKSKPKAAEDPSGQKFVENFMRSVKIYYDSVVDENKEFVNYVNYKSMILWIARFVKTRVQFATEYRSTKCRVMYHWTSSRNVANVEKYGLLTRHDISELTSVSSHGRHGMVFGDGIYFANDPFQFANYGDVLVVCITCLGFHKRIFGKGDDASFNTIIGNKGSEKNPLNDEIVVSSIAQIIPVFMIPKKFIMSPGNTYGNEYGIGLESIVESYFNPSNTPADHEEYVQIKKL